MKPTFGSLFAGIGGIDLGLERAGWECVFQVEIDPYAQKVLEKHWPTVRRWDDIRTFPPEPVDSWRCDMLAGGFPCQPVSLAGKRLGEEDERWLWPEFARCIRVLRPRFALLENVPGLLVRGMGRVLGDLAEIGYDAEWGCLSAAEFGAPHLRKRIFIVAHANGGGCKRADLSVRQSRQNQAKAEPVGIGKTVSDTNGQGLAHWRSTGVAEGETESIWGMAFSESQRCGNSWWATEPDVGRVAHGVSNRVDRIKCLGNAVVPQVAEWIGARILKIVREEKLEN